MHNDFNKKFKIFYLISSNWNFSTFNWVWCRSWFFRKVLNKYSREKYRTPLLVACKSGNFEFVKVLVEAGADVNTVDGKKKMPLNYTEKEKKF